MSVEIRSLILFHCEPDDKCVSVCCLGGLSWPLDLVSFRSRMKLYDAHNHLQDVRLGSQREAAVATAVEQGVALMVVNGTSEGDWGEVAVLAKRHSEIHPAYGLHPWFTSGRADGWEQRLIEMLKADPKASVGEIGLDRWIEGHDIDDQESVFRSQLELARELSRPATIHCLKAWGRLMDVLRSERIPERGFLLHSYGGPAELIPELVNLGARFSISGYFAHARKAKQREVLRRVPIDRLLLETDAPDMQPPDEWNRFPFVAPDGRPCNHPANIRAVYAFATEMFGISVEELADVVGRNFRELFGPDGSAASEETGSADRTAGPAD